MNEHHREGKATIAIVAQKHARVNLDERDKDVHWTWLSSTSLDRLVTPLNQCRHFLCLAKINWMNMLHPSDCAVGFRTLGGEFQSVWATRVERD